MCVVPASLPGYPPGSDLHRHRRFPGRSVDNDSKHVATGERFCVQVKANGKVSLYSLSCIITIP